MRILLTAIASAAAFPAIAADEPRLTGGGGAEEVRPLRAAPSVIRDGRVYLTGEWIELTGPMPRGACDSMTSAYDCYEPNASGAPTGGLQCGQTVADWRWWLFASGGGLYNNTFSVNDMTVSPGSRGDFAKQARIAWKWQVLGTGTSERCFISIATAENYGAACTLPASCAEYPSVTFDLGTRTANAGYLFTTLDLCPTSLGWQLPVDGSGASIIAFGRAVIDSQVIPATSAQPVLWGTGDAENPPEARAGSQGALQWDDTAPRNQVIDNGECFNYDFANLCPRPLGPALQFIAPADGGRSLLTRAQAAGAVLSPGGGVVIDATRSAVWSPTTDFGFGPGLEGLLPGASRVGPASLSSPPLTLASPGYLFWIDDQPGAEFSHPTRLVLVDATNPSPTRANGGITESPADWWPRVTIGCGQPFDVFSTLITTSSAFAPGPFNPDGLVAGRSVAPSDIVAVPPPSPGATDTSRFGLVLAGSPAEHLRGSAALFTNDLVERARVPLSNIRSAGIGSPLTRAGFFDAVRGFIQEVQEVPAPISRVFVRVAAHSIMSGGGGLWLSAGAAGNEVVTRAELIGALGGLRDLGVPVSVIISAPGSGLLPDVALWDLPPGSSIITSASAGRLAFGGAFRDGADPVTAGLFAAAFATPEFRAGADTDFDGELTDVELFDAIAANRPCYTFPNAPGLGACPFGVPPGAPEVTPDPQPRREFLRDGPRRVSLNLPNASGGERSLCRFTFLGDVRGMAAASNFSNEAFTVTGVAGGVFADYFDIAQGRTIVVWSGAPVPSGAFIHFAFGHDSRPLRLERSEWLPTSGGPTEADTFRPWRTGADAQGGAYFIDSINPAPGYGGPGELITFNLSHRSAPGLIAPGSLFPGNPQVAGLPVTNVGPIELNVNEAYAHPIPLDQSWDYDASSVIVDVRLVDAGPDPRMLLQFEPVARPACTADFDQDGDTGTDADIEAFFRVLAGGACPRCASLDLNADGDVGTDADIEAFFRLLSGGGC